MQKTISEIIVSIERFYPLLKKINDADFSLKPNPEKWSKKEELGHLIDSAQNNIQRFIRVQYEENVHIRYHADNWVAMNDYQNREKNDVVELWYLLNKQIVTILEKIPKEKQEMLMSFDKDASKKNTTLFIAEDYVKHITHHLENIVKR
jgi:predicted AlkP superfamily phosphohydrolase/phosphomutase